VVAMASTAEADRIVVSVTAAALYPPVLHSGRDLADVGSTLRDEGDGSRRSAGERTTWPLR